MDPRADALIRDLGLSPHPEGGYYRQLYRAAIAVDPHDGRGARAALTTIYFLLPRGEKSRWHRVRSDEAWHHYEGAPLELLQLSPGATRLERIALGPLSAGQAPVHCVPAGHWQAARSHGAYTLVGCTVAPGFEFADFEMLADAESLADVVRAQPGVSDYL